MDRAVTSGPGLRRRAAALVCLALAFGIALLVLRSAPGLCACLGLGEYLTPTRAIVMPLARDCVADGRQPQSRTAALIQSQAEAYRLTVQSVTVCRSAEARTGSENDFAKRFFAPEVRERWLLGYVGCCTYAFRRHFAVIVQETAEDGTTVVAATLIQSRWDYIRSLRLHCDRKLRVWL